MRCNRNSVVRGPVAPALVLIGLGLFFFLAENHLIRFRDLSRLWPLILILAGLARLSRGDRRSRATGFILLTVGAVYALSIWGFLPIQPHLLWPLILVAVGVSLLIRSFGAPGHPPDGSPGNADNFTIFGGVDLKVSGREFEGTQLTAIFAGYKLDLRKALMKGNSAVIDVSVIFGGVDLLVPPGWNVVVRTAPVFGGYSDETLHPEPEAFAPQLYIQGSVVFGGVTIKN